MIYNQTQLNYLLILSASYGLVDLVKECLNLGADPKIYSSCALYFAAKYGHTECVKLLTPVSDHEDVKYIKDSFTRHIYTT